MSPPAGAAAAHPLRGIALMVAAVSLFAVTEALAKWLARSYPPAMIVWARYLLQTLMMLALLWPRMGVRLVTSRRPGLQLVRGAILGLSSLLFYRALQSMPLADAGAITAIAPILVTALAVRLLHEQAPPGTWWALAASFAGVLLIVRPGAGVFSWVGLLPVASAFMYAGFQLMTRRLSSVDDGDATLFIGAAVATVVLTAFVPFAWRTPDSLVDAALFVATALVGWIGHLMLVRAYHEAPATLLAPFSYAHLVVSLLLGVAVFGTFPDAPALAGMAIIVVTGVRMALMRRRPAA